MVAQSIAFAYTPVGGAVKVEKDSLFDDAPWPFSRSVAALRELDTAVTETEGIEGLVLRYGFFYGPGTGYASDGYWADQVRKRRFPIVGGGGGSSPTSTSTMALPRRRWRRSNAGRLGSEHRRRRSRRGPRMATR